jgi:hypothetical protein
LSSPLDDNVANIIDQYVQLQAKIQEWD